MEDHIKKAAKEQTGAGHAGAGEAAAGQGRAGERSLFAAICDLNGNFRGKRLRANQIDKALSGAVRLPLSTAGVDIWGEDVLANALVFETGDGDGLCQPTGRGALPISWSKTPSALIPLWLANEDGTPFPGDPRRALAAITDRFKARGLTPVTATELEFYLTEAGSAPPNPPLSPLTGKPLDSCNVLSLDELEQFDTFLSDVYAACDAQDIAADTAIAENGVGQFEINLAHVADPLKAADDAIFFKRIVRGVARQHGMSATFMAKPYGTRSGSGFHTHFSLIDSKGRNVFDDGSEAGSRLLRQCVAGLLDAMAASMLIFAPHLNSYRRLLPGSHAPTCASWGYENRTAAIRIPAGPHEARRIEHRVAGADANPYLVLAAILGAALRGIEHELDPPAPLTGNAYAADLPILPVEWGAAISSFEHSAVIGEIFAPPLPKMFTACKRQEASRFAAQISPFELLSYQDVV